MEDKDSQNSFAEKIIKFGKLSMFPPPNGKDELICVFLSL